MPGMGISNIVSPFASGFGQESDDQRDGRDHYEWMQAGENSQLISDCTGIARIRQTPGDGNTSGKQNQNAPGHALCGFQSISLPPRPLGTRNRMMNCDQCDDGIVGTLRSSQVLQPPKGSRRVIQASAVKPKRSERGVLPAANRQQGELPVRHDNADAV